MTPQELNDVWTRGCEQLITQDPDKKAMANDILTLVPEVRRLRQIEAATRLFAMIVPPCDCGAYEQGKKPCSANCRLDFNFRTALYGDSPVAI